MAASTALLLSDYEQSGAFGFAEPPRQYPVRQFVKSLHQNHDGAEHMRDDTPFAGRKNPEHLPITKRNALRLVSSGLQSALRNASAPVKRIAKIAEVDRKTAASWYHGYSAPGLHHLLNLMAEIPELAGEIRRVTQMERDTHEDLQREIAALIQKAMQR